MKGRKRCDCGEVVLTTPLAVLPSVLRILSGLLVTSSCPFLRASRAPNACSFPVCPPILYKTCWPVHMCISHNISPLRGQILLVSPATPVRR